MLSISISTDGLWKQSNRVNSGRDPGMTKLRGRSEKHSIEKLGMEEIK